MKPRLPHLITGTVTVLAAAGSLALGGGLLWLDDRKDADGYLNTGSQEYRAAGAAIVTENIDVDLDGAGFLIDSDEDAGTVRVTAEADRGGKPLFVGVARTADVDRYLGGVAHSTLRDVDYDPFDPTYAEHAGKPRADAPVDQRFWLAKGLGSRGEQVLRWNVDEGDWKLVVMNADGSPGVAADVDAGAKVDVIDDLGWSAIGLSGALTLAGGALLLTAFRPRRRGPGLGEPLPAA
jgi:hypothetical protein